MKRFDNITMKIESEYEWIMAEKLFFFCFSSVKEHRDELLRPIEAADHVLRNYVEVI